MAFFFSRQYIGDLLIPFGKRVFRVVVTVIAFWAISAPICSVAALTNLITHDPQTKMAWTLMCTIMANTMLGLVFGIRLLCMDWTKASLLLKKRANTDAVAETRTDTEAPLPSSDGTSPGEPPSGREARGSVQ